MNYGVLLTYFENKYPKFFNKVKQYKVMKGNDLLFDTITTYKEQDDPALSFRAKFDEELL